MTRSWLVGLAFVAAPLTWGSAAETEIQRTPSPAGAHRYFISPHDGAGTSTPVTVRFELPGMGASPAGVAKPSTGHPPLTMGAGHPTPGQPISADTHHLHFGGGQTEVTLDLAPGSGTLLG